jgi:POT family proton-dependent oligopeptide transporter
MNIVLIVGLAITVLTGLPVLMQMRRHPPGLTVVFLAEMWERFSYYGMRAILIYYLTQHFLFDDKTAQGQYGAYTSLIYLLPLVGGVVADRWLGMRKAVMLGGVLLVLGHLGMGLEGPPATQSLTYAGADYRFETTGRGEARDARLKVGEATYSYGPAPGGGIALEGLPADAPLPAVLPPGSYELKVDRSELFESTMYLALSLIIMGVCFLKANLSAIVGQLYRQGDPRRDPGFTLYYYGINLGSFWAAVVCGWLGTTVGWWAGFGMAGLGMTAGLICFVFGRKRLEGVGEPPSPARLAKAVAGPITVEHLIYLASLGGVAMVWLLLGHNRLVGYMLGAGSVLVLGYLAWHMAKHCSRVEAQRLGLALVLIAAAVVFWTLFEQAGSSMSQFAERNTDLAIGFGQTITASQTQSLNPGFILLFAPVFAALWTWLGQRGKDPNPVVKFGLALLQVGLGFLVLVYGSSFADGQYRVPVIFLTLAYMLHTTGELCLSPVGLSQMTKLSTGAVVATIMATWFISNAWAQWIGGWVAQLTAQETVAGRVLDPGKALETYDRVFTQIGWWGIAFGVLMLAISPWLSKWAHGASDVHALPQEPVDGDRQSVA